MHIRSCSDVALKLAPVEIVAVALFAEDMYEAQRHTHDEPASMASGIKDLRQRLRRKFPGTLRSNDNVLEFAISIIKTWMRSHRRLVKNEVDAVVKNEVMRVKNEVTQVKNEVPDVKDDPDSNSFVSTFSKIVYRCNTLCRSDTPQAQRSTSARRYRSLPMKSST